MKDKNCPVCGADTLTKGKRTQILHEPYGGQISLEIAEYYCSTCDSSGDFFNENEDLINSYLDTLQANSIINIIDDFNNNKISMSAIERALSLPQRTITKWKNGVSKPSATALALMKLIRTFPWLIEVAESNFDYNIAQKIHITNAVQLFMNTFNFESNTFIESGIIATSQLAYFYMQIDRSQPKNPNLPNIEMMIPGEPYTTT